MDNAPAADTAAAPPAALPGKLPALVRADARVGLYGGMFDPPHLGHLAVAREALGELGLERLFFIPAAQAPLRSGPAVASAEDRLEMLRRAVAEAAHARLGILDLEVQTGGVNYTVNTVRQLQAAWPRARLVLLIGMDQFANLHSWREPEALAKLVEFAVFDRVGVATAAPNPALARLLRWQYLSGVQHPASSSEIRRRLSVGEKADEWLPRSVAAYIEEKKLYR
jgi:nicotinate-nucleotide adenylyltransferase